MNSNDFFGMGGQPGTNELNQQQILAFGGNFTSIYCSRATAAAAVLTFTLRKATPSGVAVNTTLICTIPTLSRTGSTIGASVAFSAGDLISIQAGAVNPNSPISISVGVGP